jgi:hypothetical protein
MEAVAGRKKCGLQTDDLVGRILVALGKLDAAVDVEHAGPSKHNGIAALKASED